MIKIVREYRCGNIYILLKIVMYLIKQSYLIQPCDSRTNWANKLDQEYFKQ